MARRPILVVKFPLNKYPKIVEYFRDKWEGRGDYWVIFGYADVLDFELLSVGKARKIDFDKLKEEVLESLTHKDKS